MSAPISTSARQDLDGQVAIVTGGGRGFGRSFAEGLAAAGATVAVVARTDDQIRETVGRIADAGGRALAVAADVTDRQAVERMVTAVHERLGPVDLLVNNAGVHDAIGPVWDVDPDRWWRELDVNLRGPFLCARAVLPGMVERGHGRVINVASRGGTVARTYRSAYACSKAALIRLTECVALEAERLAPGVRVFAIHPGTVLTPMNAGHLANPDMLRWVPEMRDYAEVMRSKSPDPAVRLVLYLASGQADALSGRYLDAEADDVEDLVRRAAEIERADSRVLRIAT